MNRSIICEAIRRRSLLEFEYTGLHRVVAPYCHGLSTTNVESVRAVQIRGSSHGKGFGFGKLWTVSKIVKPLITDETFTPDDPDYNPNDSGMNQIHCRV